MNINELIIKLVLISSVSSLIGCGGSSSGVDTPDVDENSRQNVSLVGSVEKGPFVIGSTVIVNELSEIGTATNSTLTTQTTDDLGSFSFSYTEGRLVQISATGYYRNEITGELSSGTINLRSVYRVSSQETQAAHVNILTHLSSGRVLQLISEGESIEGAKVTANDELMTFLNVVVPISSIDDFSNLSIYGNVENSDGNAYLTLISTLFYQHAIATALINGSNPDAELTLLLNSFSSDMQDGIIDDLTIAAALQSAIPKIDPVSVMKNLTEIASLAQSDSQPSNINLYLDSDLDGISNELDSDDDGDGILDLIDSSPYTKNFNVEDAVFDTDEDTDVSLYFSVNSPQEGGNITYNLRLEPSNGVLIGEFPNVSYRPNLDYNGSDTVRLYLSQGDIQSEDITLTVNVLSHDDAPVISGQPQTSIVAFESYAFTPIVSDADSSNLVFSIENKPDWVSFSTTTGVLSGIPENSDSGEYTNIVIQVSDESNDASLEVFNINVTSSPWIPKADMPVEHSSNASTQVDGVIFLFGGATTNVFAYYPETNLWEAKTPIPTWVHSISAHNIDGLVYVLSGYGKEGFTNLVQIYNPINDSWTLGSPAPTSRYIFSSAVVDGKIYVIGGQDSDWSMTTIVEEYNPSTDTWTTKASVPSACGESSASAINGKIYVVGGCYPSGSSKVDIYDPVVDSWSAGTAMNYKRYGLSTAVLNGKLYAFGGVGGSSAVSILEVYDPISSQWVVKSNMRLPRYRFSTEVLNGGIYVFGGGSTSNSKLSSVEFYDAAIDE